MAPVPSQQYQVYALDSTAYRNKRATCKQTGYIYLIYPRLRIRRAIEGAKEKFSTIEAIYDEIHFNVFILASNLQCCLEYNISEIQCDMFEDIGQKLALLKISEPPTILRQQVIFYPVNKTAALKIIRCLYNGTKDPSEKIEVKFLTKGLTLGSVLVTYYISCIKYFIDVELDDLLVGDHFRAIGNPGILFLQDPSGSYNYDFDSLEVDASVVIFHAVFGGYALCRGTQGKAQLSDWCRVRYNSLMSSLKLQIKETVQFNLKTSGEAVNKTTSTVTGLLNFIYRLLFESTVNHPIANAIITHLKFLTAFTGMTTYSFIMTVINQGGAIVALKPIPTQLISFIREKNEIYTKMDKDGHDRDRIAYLHLIYENIQCFKAASYPDLVVAAKYIELSLNKDAKKNLDRYISKASNYASINIKQLKHFLHQRSMISAIEHLDNNMIEMIRTSTGLDMRAQQLEAEKIMNTISQEKLVIYRAQDSDDEDD